MKPLEITSVYGSKFFAPGQVIAVRTHSDPGARPNLVSVCLAGSTEWVGIGARYGPEGDDIEAIYAQVREYLS